MLRPFILILVFGSWYLNCSNKVSSQSYNNHETYLIKDNVIKIQKDSFEVHEIQQGNKRRVIGVYRPASIIDDYKYPVVLVLHGGGGNYSAMREKTKWDILAHKEKFIVGYLQAQNICWNKNGQPTQGNYWLTNAKQDKLFPDQAVADDGDYLDLAIAQLNANYPIDKNRIYAVGFSNGLGYLLDKVITRQPNIVAAIGGVGSMVHKPFQGNSDSPLMMVIGQNDSRFTAHSGISFFPMKDEYSVLTEDTQKWNIAYLTSYLKVGKQYNFVKRSRCIQFDFLSDDPDANHMFRYVLVTGLGHKWPKKEDGFNATQRIWKFLKQYQNETEE